MTFTPKGVDGRGIVFADFSFLSVVAHTCSEVGLQSGVDEISCSSARVDMIPHPRLLTLQWPHQMLKGSSNL
jgi:hypothetical protein